MAEVKATAPKFSLSQNDFLKGLLMAVGTPVIAVLLATVQAGSWEFDWNMIGTTAVSALLMYLGKNFFNGPSLVVQDPSKNMIKEAKEGNLEVVKK
jgi:membrane protein implicated in regulation of membrane protease activity